MQSTITTSCGELVLFVAPLMLAKVGSKIKMKDSNTVLVKQHDRFYYYYHHHFLVIVSPEEMHLNQTSI